MSDPSPYYTPSELAHKYKVTKRTLQRWRWLGIGPKHSKIGGSIRYLKSEVEEYDKKRVFQSTIEGEIAPP